MPQSWKQQEIEEHGIKPCSDEWFMEEEMEGHIHPIGSKKWMLEEQRESAHLQSVLSPEERRYLQSIKI